MTTPYVAAPPRRVWMSTVSAVLSALTVLLILGPVLAILLVRATAEEPLLGTGMTELAPSGPELLISAFLAVGTLLPLALPALVLAVLSPWWTRLEKVLVIATPWTAAVMVGLGALLRIGAGGLVLDAVLLVVALAALGTLLLVLARRAHRRAHTT